MTNFALPAAFQRGIENLAADISRSDIAERAEKISQNYIRHKASRSVIVNSADVAASLTSRGPATYAACAAAMSGGNGQEKYDLVVASYAIGELALNDMRSTLQTLWRSAARSFVIVEPGTP